MLFRRDRLRAGTNGEGARRGRDAIGRASLLPISVTDLSSSSYSNNILLPTIPVFLTDTPQQSNDRHLFITSPPISRRDAHSAFVKGAKVPHHTAVSRICRPLLHEPLLPLPLRDLERR